MNIWLPSTTMNHEMCQPANIILSDKLPNSELHALSFDPSSWTDRDVTTIRKGRDVEGEESRTRS